MLKIYDANDIESVEKYLIDNIRSHDIVISNDYEPYEIKRHILNASKSGVLFDVRFTSVTRLAKEYLDEAGMEYRHIDMTTSLFLVSELIRKNKSKLKTISSEFKEMRENKYILDEIIELRQKGVNSEDFKVLTECALKEDSPGLQPLKLKLLDMQILLKSYEDVLEDGLLDAEGAVSEAIRLMEDSLTNVKKTSTVRRVNKVIKLIENPGVTDKKHRIFYIQTPETSLLELEFLQTISKYIDVHILQDEVTENISLIEDTNQTFTSKSGKEKTHGEIEETWSNEHEVFPEKLCNEQLHNKIEADYLDVHQVFTAKSCKNGYSVEAKYLRVLPSKSINEDATVAVSYIFDAVRKNAVKPSEIAVIAGDEESLEQVQGLLESTGLLYNQKSQKYINKVFMYIDELLKYCSTAGKDELSKHYNEAGNEKLIKHCNVAGKEKLLKYHIVANNMTASKEKFLNLVKLGFAGFLGCGIDKAVNFFAANFDELIADEDTIGTEIKFKKTQGGSFDQHNENTMDTEVKSYESSDFTEEHAFFKATSLLAENLKSSSTLDEKIDSLENFFAKTNFALCIEKYCENIDAAFQKNINFKERIKSLVDEFINSLRNSEKCFYNNFNEEVNISAQNKHLNAKDSNLAESNGFFEDKSINIIKSDKLFEDKYFNAAEADKFFEVAHLLLDSIIYMKNDILFDAISVCSMDEMLFENKKLVIILESSKDITTNYSAKFFTFREQQYIQEQRDNDGIIDKKEAGYLRSYLNKIQKADTLVVIQNREAGHQQNEIHKVLADIYRESYLYEELTEGYLDFLMENSSKDDEKKSSEKTDFELSKEKEEIASEGIDSKLPKDKRERLRSRIDFRLKKDTVQRLYDISFKDNKYDVFMSPTGIESLGACPFRYFLDRGIGVSEAKVDFIDPKRRGEIYHKILEEVALYIVRLAKRNDRGLLDFSKISEDEIKSVVDEVISGEIRNIKKAQDGYRCRCIAKKAYPAALDILSELRAGDIKDVMPEEKFKDGQRIPGIKLEGNEKFNVNISGKIDRVDVFASKKTRIIDYKTYENKLNTRILDNDWKPQLLIYLMAIVSNESFEFGSLFYKKIIRDSKPGIDAKNIHFNGIMLDDEIHLNEEFKNASDPREFFAVDKDNNGIVKGRNSKSKFVDEDYILEKLDRLEKQIYVYVDEFLKGSVMPKKKRFKNTCDYCNYMQICEKDNL